MQIKTSNVLVMATASPVASVDKLYEGFLDPHAEARPFVRWWWDSGCSLRLKR